MDIVSEDLLNLFDVNNNFSTNSQIDQVVSEDVQLSDPISDRKERGNNMKIPYIKVKQKGEIFFLTKFNAKELKEHIHFHVRDPYIESQSKELDKFEDYMGKLTKRIVF